MGAEMMAQAATGLLGAGAGIAGTIMTNNANKALQESANATNIQLANENRMWQERMANTAHQREIADLKAAGLNPILTATGGSGAATPSGNVAQVNAARMEDFLGKGASSAMAAMNLKKDLSMADSQQALNASAIDTQQSQRDLNVSNASKARQETIRVAVDNDIRGPTLDSLKRAAKEQAEADLKTAAMDNKMATFDAVQRRTKNALDTVGSAKDLINPFKGIFGPGKNIPPVGEIFKNRKGVEGFYDKGGKFNTTK